MTRRRAHEDDGFTLVELLVSMSLLLIVGTIVMTSVIQGNRSSLRAQERAEGISELQLATERVTRELRAADPIVLAQADAVEMDIVRDGVTRRLRYALTGGQLVETRGTGAAATTTVLAEGVTDFRLTYLTSGGTVLTAPVPTGNLGQIVRVAVHIERFIQSAGEPIELETTVHIRNSA